LDVAAKGRQKLRQDVLCSFFPVTLFDGRRGAIELQESLRERDEFIHRSIRSTVVETVTVACLCGIIATGLGISLVGKPVHELVEQARRVGRGDLSTRITQAHRDELGELAREMNAMCDQLASAQDNVAVSAAARLAAVEQLRHADRLRTVGQLASGIAHELGTPLNVVSGRAKMIVGGEAVGAEAVESARAIVEQTERMTRIIRQLLDFARRREPAKIEQDLTALARQTIALLTPLAAKRGTEIQFKAQEKARIQIDSQQIQQALANLLMNAIQAMPDGGTIQVALGKRWVTPPADHGGTGGEYWAIEVEDTGSGMPPEVASRAFEPFFTTKDVGEGTGLGLAVAYGMVREHGGWIDLRSVTGQGSRFTIFLPGAVA
ncbi:MAG TPA: HAMP domain-containing sensor histidine kinase, partial [Candidatus Udaeobacter sp.]|nr:HAMP domain-containing sensor histidine kinase [Candidatus Udaeobacter sp.]